MLSEGLGSNLILENSEGKWEAPSQPVLYSYCYYLCVELWASCSAIWTRFHFASFRFGSIRSLKGQEGGQESRSIYTRRRTSGCCEPAEACKKQAMSSTAKGRFDPELPGITDGLGLIRKEG
jgi:hypothetical protein